MIFDRALLRRRRRRAAALGPATFLLDRVADDLAERLTTVLRRFALAVDLGTPGEAVHNALMRLESVDRIVTADVMPDAARGEIFVAADEEAPPFGDATLDLVVSALALQFVNDLPGVLVQIRRALKPDGLLLAALLGGETLTELRQKARSKAVFRRASRRSPICAISARCCSARASRSPSPTPTASSYATTVLSG